MKHSRRTLRRVGLVAGTSLLALAAIGPAASPTLAKPSGSIQTTGEDCWAIEPQNDNSYEVGQTVYVRGQNFAASTVFTWTITGKPGGASGDPNQDVTTGGSTTDAAGSFCVAAYVIDASDWGEYSVSVDQGSTHKNDNYSVEPGDAQEPEDDGDDPSDPPTDEETTPPTDDETTPPSDEQTTPPTDDETTPPTDEETTPPSDDETTPPSDEETTPPTDEETTPPTDDETTPPTDDETTPPSDEETTPPSDESPTDDETTPPTDDETPTEEETPSDEETTPPSDEQAPVDDATPSDEETTPPSDEQPLEETVDETDDANTPPVEETDTDADTPADTATGGVNEAPSQEVLGVVSGGPTVTPPPTDTIVAPSDQGSGTDWRVIVAVLGILILAVTIGLPERRRAA